MAKPFQSKLPSHLFQLGEIGLIQKIQKLFPTSDPHVIRGIGDDCAVLNFGQKKLLLTTDALLEKIHFDWKWTDPFLLGRKALAVNLSDIAAMGGVPKWALLSVAFPAKESVQKVMQFYRGLREVAKEYSVELIGGDSDHSNGEWKITLTLIGEATRPIFRRGANLGDQIGVVGEPGFSALGFEALKRSQKNRVFSPFIQAHQNPIPWVRIAQKLAQKRYLTSMIDLSDGLLLDLERLCDASEVGVHLELKEEMIAPNFKKAAEHLKLDPLTLFLSGGEDYALLLTFPEKLQLQLLQFFKATEVPFKKLGTVVERKKKIELFYEGKKISNAKKGFSHF